MPKAVSKKDKFSNRKECKKAKLAEKINQNKSNKFFIIMKHYW
jgi:hypothetical protein